MTFKNSLDSSSTKDRPATEEGQSSWMLAPVQSSSTRRSTAHFRRGQRLISGEGNGAGNEGINSGEGNGSLQARAPLFWIGLTSGEGKAQAALRPALDQGTAQGRARHGQWGRRGASNIPPWHSRIPAWHSGRPSSEIPPWHSCFFLPGIHAALAS